MDPGSLLLVLALLALILVMTNNGRKRRREMLKLREGLQPGRKIMTGSGLFATVVEIEGEHIVLETGPGQTSRWLRQAVVRILPAEPEARSEADPAAEETDAPAVPSSDDAAERAGDA